MSSRFLFDYDKVANPFSRLVNIGYDVLIFRLISSLVIEQRCLGWHAYTRLTRFMPLHALLPRKTKLSLKNDMKLRQKENRRQDVLNNNNNVSIKVDTYMHE